MNALETAIYSKLTGDTTLMALVGAVCNTIVPRGQALPVCLFQPMSGIEENASPNDSIRYVYLVKGIARSKATAMAIAERASYLLHKSTITVTGWNNFWTARTLYVSYAEIDPAQPSENIWHVGWEYVIRLA